MGKYQIRRTFEDAKSAQIDLKRIMNNKINRNVALSIDEKKDFYNLVTEAVRSRISFPCHIRAPSDGRLIYMGTIVEFCEVFLQQEGKIALVKDLSSEKVYEMKYSHLWKEFKRILLKLFGYALEEAMHMSAERQVKERAGAYSFGSKKHK